jgi:hypothetical protein
MTMKRTIPAIYFTMLLSACGPQKVDYEASSACSNKGYQVGSEEFKNCVKEERALKLMEQNRREFEQRRADDEYQRSRRSAGY